MVNPTIELNAIRRRFDEIFLIDLRDITRVEDFEYFVQRIADYYQHLKDKHPEFINHYKAEEKTVDKKISSEMTVVNDFLDKIATPITEKLSKEPKFNNVLDIGKKEFLKHLNKGAYSPIPEEMIYQSYDWKMKYLLPSADKRNFTLDESKEIVFYFTRCLYELKNIGLKNLVTKDDEVIKKAEELSMIIESAQKKAYRMFDYSRLLSLYEVENIWKNEYEPGAFSALSLRVHILKDNLKSHSAWEKQQILRECMQLRIHVQRAYNALVDWVEAQNYIEEALLNTKIWAEVVNNDELVKKYQSKKVGAIAQKEKILKNELAKFLFNSYKILCIREPGYRKIPDFIIPTMNSRIVSEAKIVDDGVTASSLETTVIQGLKQIQSYSHLFPYIDSAALVVFNFSDIELTNKLYITQKSTKPIYFLSININTKPSGKKFLKFTNEALEDCIKAVGL